MPTLVLEERLAEKFWIWSVWTRLTWMVLARIVLARAHNDMVRGSFMVEVLGGGFTVYRIVWEVMTSIG